MKKPFMAVTHNGRQIMITNKATETALIINGYKVDVYTSLVAFPFSLKGVINGDLIRAEFKLHLLGGTMFLYYNDVLLAKKWHI